MLKQIANSHVALLGVPVRTALLVQRLRLHVVNTPEPPVVCADTLATLKALAPRVRAQANRISFSMAADMLQAHECMKAMYGCGVMTEAIKEAKSRSHAAHGSHSHSRGLMGSTSHELPTRCVASVLATLAEHVTDLSAFSEELDRVAHEHVHLGITSADHERTAEHLLRSMRKELGAHFSAADEKAWADAHGAITKLLVEREKEVRQELVMIMQGAHPPHNEMDTTVVVPKP
jgi:hemoglobin-like flavoprotein